MPISAAYVSLYLPKFNNAFQFKKILFNKRLTNCIKICSNRTNCDINNSCIGLQYSLQLWAAEHADGCISWCLGKNRLSDLRYLRLSEAFGFLVVQPVPDYC